MQFCETNGIIRKWYGVGIRMDNVKWSINLKMIEEGKERQL